MADPRSAFRTNSVDSRQRRHVECLPGHGPLAPLRRHDYLDRAGASKRTAKSASDAKPVSDDLAQRQGSAGGDSTSSCSTGLIEAQASDLFRVRRYWSGRRYYAKSKFCTFRQGVIEVQVGAMDDHSIIRRHRLRRDLASRRDDARYDQRLAILETGCGGGCDPESVLVTPACIGEWLWNMRRCASAGASSNSSGVL